MALTDTQKLLALEEIRLLKPRYCRFVDIKDWAGFRALFADDARFQYRPPNGPWETPEQACQRIEQLLVGAVTVHHVHAPEIEMVSDTQAKGVWAVEDWVFHDPARGLQSFHGQGHYHETYVRVGGAWKIGQLQLTRLRMENVDPSQ